jgi:hypothetical protein
MQQVQPRLQPDSLFLVHHIVVVLCHQLRSSRFLTTFQGMMDRFIDQSASGKTLTGPLAERVDVVLVKSPLLFMVMSPSVLGNCWLVSSMKRAC